jgi:hypothetical protein
MAIAELRKSVKFKSYRQTPKTDLKLKKIQQIDHLFHEEICVFQTAEFQKLHNTMTLSRKKLFAEWNKVLKELVEFKTCLKDIEERMVQHENTTDCKYIENNRKQSESKECDKDLFDCIANT